MAVLTTVLGYPRQYWQQKVAQSELQESARMLMHRQWELMKQAGIDDIPSNHFSLCDHVLDTAVMLGLTPARYRAVADPLDRYFAMARGRQGSGVHIAALETTRWFDTNDHYIVPELEPCARARLCADKILHEVDDARALGVRTRPVILGPVSFLRLSRLAHGAVGSTLDLLDTVLDAYSALLSLLREEGVHQVQLDEPCLVLELGDAEKEAYREAFSRLSTLTSRPRMLLATHIGALRENLSLATGSGFEALHVDLVRAPEQLDDVVRALPERMTLSLGLIDGSKEARSELEAPLRIVREVVAKLGEDRVWVAPAGPLLHVHKLGELRALAELANARAPSP